MRRTRTATIAGVLTLVVVAVLAVLTTSTNDPLPELSSDEVPVVTAAGTTGPVARPAVCGPRDLTCASELLGSVTRAQGVTAGLAALGDAEAANPGVCHPLEHAVGQASAGLLDSWWDAVALRSDCNFGFAHGFVEGRLSDSALADVAATGAELCEPRDGSNLGVWGNCFHGVGHGAIKAAGGDVAQALQACAALGVERAGTDPVAACADGVFMQFANDAQQVAGGGTVDGADNSMYSKDTVLGLCAEMVGGVARSCWLYAGALWATFMSGDVAGMIERCPHGDFGPVCAQGVGRAAVLLVGFDATALFDSCGDGPLGGPCVRGGAENAALFSGTGQAEVGDLCAGAPKGVADACRAGWLDGQRQARGSAG